jgi:glucosamine--fructose-6-phosphate aminotransferase (isomerizing)
MLGQLMESEIREQPALLAKNQQRYFKELTAALKGKEFDMVLLAARGSSDNAALFARYLIEIHLQIPVSLAAPSVLTRFGSKVRYSKCLAVGISQSGAAPDVSEVIAQMKADGHTTLAITNTAGSRLTQVADHSLLLGCGDEKSVAATKTYSASLLALYEMVRAMGGDIADPAGLLPTAEWNETCKATAEKTLGPILRCSNLFSLSRGYGFCTAQESALKLMECALLACKSYSVADFEHGPKALAAYGSAAIVYGEDCSVLQDQGCIVVRAPQSPQSLQGPLSPIWDIFYGQWLALTAARARGLNPDDPQHLKKVTETL